MYIMSEWVDKHVRYGLSLKKERHLLEDDSKWMALKKCFFFYLNQ